MKTPNKLPVQNKITKQTYLKQIIFLESFCEVLNGKQYGFSR